MALSNSAEFILVSDLIAMASKLYRTEKFNQNNFSNNGNEIAWGTIGNASTSEVVKGNDTRLSDARHPILP